MVSHSGENRVEYVVFCSVLLTIVPRSRRSVTDPRNGKRVALKKMPNVFQSLTSSKRAYRELKMLCFFKHNNVGFRFSKFLILNAGISLKCRVYIRME